MSFTQQVLLKLILAFMNSSPFELLLLYLSGQNCKSELNPRLRFLFKNLSEHEFEYSQLGQDLFVLEQLNWKRNGFFVEVGACHPLRLSNTYYLEEFFSWDGVLIEPNPHLAEKLRENRKSRVVESAVGMVSGHVDLLISVDPEFSSTKEQLHSGKHKLFKESGEVFVVRSLTLTNILDSMNVPQHFDYLSLDIEGGELEALLSLDFAKYRPKIITVEHNFRKDREAMASLLLSKGYCISPKSSKYSWDDWYVAENRN